MTIASRPSRFPANLGLLLGVALMLLSVAPSARADDGKYALVIGNAAYEHAAPLANTVNDAKAISDELRDLGFEVVLGLDLDHEGTLHTIDRFFDRASDMKVGLFFYSGHGAQVNGQNFMIPTDAAFHDAASSARGLVSIGALLKYLDRRSEVGLVYLDACRNNPFDAVLRERIEDGRLTVTRSLSGVGGRGLRPMGVEAPIVEKAARLEAGLARIDGGAGLHIAFATRPGAVASDGLGRHSPFTAGLLKHIGEPGLSVEDLDRLVRKHVIDLTGGDQTPWSQSSLDRAFVFREVEKKRRRIMP